MRGALVPLMILIFLSIAFLMWIDGEIRVSITVEDKRREIVGYDESKLVRSTSSSLVDVPKSEEKMKWGEPDLRITPESTTAGKSKTDTKTGSKENMPNRKTPAAVKSEPKKIPAVSNSVAKKTNKDKKTNDNTTSNAKSKKNRRIFFIHVGKCGGTTLKGNLRSRCFGIQDASKRQNCEREVRHAREPALSKQNVGYMHSTTVEPNKKALSDATSLLLVVRNPIDRVASWFVFTNPTNCKVEGTVSCRQHLEEVAQLFACFPKSMDSFAKSLAPDSSGKCSTLARRAMKSEMHGMGQLELNYQFYFERMGGLSKEILVVRNEHLWEDVANLESFITTGTRGANVDITSAFIGPKQVKHEHLNKVEREISKEGRKHLCCYLVEEIRIYNKLLDAAVNLNKGEVVSSKNAVLTDTCGVPDMETLQKECSVYP